MLKTIFIIMVILLYVNCKKNSTLLSPDDLPVIKLLYNLDGHNGVVNYISFNNESTFLVSAGQDNTAKIWDLTSGTIITSLNGHNNPVTAAVFHPTRNIVATSEEDSIRIWDMDSHTIMKSYNFDDSDSPLINYNCKCLLFSPDGETIIAGGGGSYGRVRWWNIETDVNVNVPEISTWYNINMNITFWVNNSGYIVGGFEENIYIWDFLSGELSNSIYIVDEEMAELNSGSPIEIYSVDIDHDGSTVLIGCEDPIDRIKLYNISSSRQLKTDFFGTKAIFLNNDNYIISYSSMSSSSAVFVWHVYDNNLFAKLAEFNKSLITFTMSLDGKYLALSFSDGSLQLWEIKNSP